MPRIARNLSDIRAEARKHTLTAINTLVGIAAQRKAPSAARVAAANALLDRGWEKPTQAVDLGTQEADPFAVYLQSIAGNVLRPSGG